MFLLKIKLFHRKKLRTRLDFLKILLKYCKLSNIVVVAMHNGAKSKKMSEIKKMFRSAWNILHRIFLASWFQIISQFKKKYVGSNVGNQILKKRSDLDKNYFTFFLNGKRKFFIFQLFCSIFEYSEARQIFYFQHLSHNERKSFLFLTYLLCFNGGNFGI